MSIEKARTYLDEKANKETSDEELLATINACYELADIAIDEFLDRKNRKR